MKVIPTKIHGIIDYLMGGFLILMPRFYVADSSLAQSIDTSVGTAATTVPVVVGFIIIGQALVTRYEWGVFKMLTMRTHLAMDYALGAFLVAAPWIFSYPSDVAQRWHLVAGLTILVLTALSQKEPTASSLQVFRGRGAH